MVNLKFYITGKEYLPSEIISLARDFGCETTQRSITRINETLIDAVKYLRLKGVFVKALLPSGQELLDMQEETGKGVKQIEYKVDENCMIVLFEDGVYEVNPAYLTEECWDVQLFGNPGCQKCADKNKALCNGENVLKNGKNELGNEIPLAKRIGDRPKREWKK